MNSFIMGFVAILTCVCFYLLANDKKTTKKLIWIIYSIIFAITISWFFSKVIYRMFHPVIWDFTAFYLYGKVSAQGYNFYLPENFHLVYNSLNLPASLNIPNANWALFVNHVVNVGFPYPPPTMLYFAPLGYLSYNNALIFWTLFNFLFVFGCIYLVYSLFFKEYKLNGLMLVSILFFTLSPARETIFYTQTNFILLFLLLLMKKYSDNKIAGIFLALALFTKPYMLIFSVYFILRKKWSTIFYFIFSSTLLIGLTWVFFGKAPFISYIFNNSVNRLPKSAFSEDINQSLHAVLLRHNFITIDNPRIYIFISIGILFLTGIFLLYLLKKKFYDNIWAILLLIGLMIYPATLSYYGVLLLFIIYQFFDEHRPLGFNQYFNVPIVGIFYFLSHFSVFSSICFLLIIIIYKS
ncbi:MAG: glycosyltransferase family 87 protein, partial [Ginsengibacter sp.]